MNKNIVIATIAVFLFTKGADILAATCLVGPGNGVPQINDLAKRDGCTTEYLDTKCKPTDRMHPVCVEYQNCTTDYPCPFDCLSATRML